MKYFVTFILISSSLFSQNTNNVDSNGKKDGLWKGVFEESKRPRYEGTFKHGKEIGIFKFFDDTKDGVVLATRDFSSKDNSCYTIFYNQKKNIVSEGKVVNKLFEGEWKYYHEDSDKIMTSEIYLNGKLNGTRKVYYPTGTIAEEASYKNGLKDGNYKKYAENGVVLEDSNYTNNEFDGEATFKNPENVTVAKGKFVKGKKEGIWEFLKKGKIVKENMSLPNKIKFVKKEIKKEE